MLLTRPFGLSSSSKANSFRSSRQRLSRAGRSAVSVLVSNGQCFRGNRTWLLARQSRLCTLRATNRLFKQQRVSRASGLKTLHVYLKPVSKLRVLARVLRVRLSKVLRLRLQRERLASRLLRLKRRLNTNSSFKSVGIRTNKPNSSPISRWVLVRCLDRPPQRNPRLGSSRTGV